MPSRPSESGDPFSNSSQTIRRDAKLAQGYSMSIEQAIEAEAHTQMEQALSNIAGIVRAAGGGVNDIGRLTLFVKDKAEYNAHQRESGQVYRRVSGKHFPAMSMRVINDLIEDEALIEIEATADIAHDELR